MRARAVKGGADGGDWSGSLRQPNAPEAAVHVANPTSATILARNRQDSQFACNARQEGAALRHWRRRRGRARVVPVSVTAAAIAIAATADERDVS